jgi:DHA2 family multidrug resistance protein
MATALSIPTKRVYPVGLERIILIGTAITASLLQLIDSSIVNVSLREIAGSIGATPTEVAWIVTSYAVSNVIMIPLSGILGDYFGRKPYFTFSIILFTVASLFCGTANGLWTMVFWRFLQGLGGGALLTTAQTIVIECFPPEKLSIGNGIFGAGLVLGPTIGPSLGGFITDNYSWHWIFFINVPIGVLAAILSWQFVKNRVGAVKPRMDWAGIAFLVMFVGALQYILEEGQTNDWFESNLILIVAMISLLGLVAFIYWEWTSPNPAVNIRLLKYRNMWAGGIFTAVLGMILLATVFVFPLFVQIGLGWTATKTGNFMVTGALASAVGMLAVGRMLSKGISAKTLMLTGAAMVIVFSGIMSFSSPDSDSANFFWPFILRGLGISLMMSPVMTLTIQGMKGSALAQSAGITNMIRQLGGAVGIAVMNILLNHRNAVNYSYLSQYTNIYNDKFSDRLQMLTQQFIGKGYYKDQAEMMAYQLLNSSLLKQESLVSYNNIFWMVAVSTLCAVPLILLTRSKKGGDAHSEMIMD